MVKILTAIIIFVILKELYKTTTQISAAFSVTWQSSSWQSKCLDLLVQLPSDKR